MIRRLIDWNRRRREWNVRHLAAWRGASVHGADGLSPFQHRCEAQLRRELSVVGLSLVERVVESVREHEFIRAEISSTSVTIWIHDDVAGFDGPGGGRRFEEWDYETPEQLSAAFCTHVVRAARAGDITKAQGSSNELD
jgi:hypothetical protein